MTITAKLLKAAIAAQSPLIATKSGLQATSRLVTKKIQNPSINGKTWIHTTGCRQYPGQDWRKRHGLPANPNAYGPLTDGPDYSYLDGRPTPVGSGKLKRAREQIEITSSIMKLNAEVDSIVANHEARVKAQAEEKARIIRNKLNPKGKIPPEV